MTSSNNDATASDGGLSRPALGIGLTVIAVSMFAFMDALAKYASESIRVEMVVWGRYFFHFAAMLLLLPFLGVKRSIRTSAPVRVTLRGLLLLACTICFFTAISMIPLAEANAIVFVSPLITVALSVLFLREQVGIRRWSAVGVGFIGMLLIFRPGFQDVHWAYFLALAMAGMFSIFALLTRSLTKTEDPVAMLFHTALIGCLGSSLIVSVYWEMPDTREWFILLVIGLIGGISHMILIYGYRFAPASVLAPFQYVIIVWSTFFGYAVFGDIPDIWTVSGASLIVGAGLYVWLRERAKQRAAALQPETG